MREQTKFLNLKTWLTLLCLALAWPAAHAAWYIMGDAPFTWTAGSQEQLTDIGSNKFRIIKTTNYSSSTWINFILTSSNSSEWGVINSNRYGSSNGNGINVYDGQWTQTYSGNNGGNIWTELNSGSFIWTWDSTNKKIRIDKNTGELYLFGKVASQNIDWNPTQGVTMTTTDHKIYTLSNVELVDGDNFRFTMKKSSNSSDWNTANSVTFGPTNAQALTEGTVQLSDFGTENNFTINSSNAGTYNISVNIETCKVIFTKINSPVTSSYTVTGVASPAVGGTVTPASTTELQSGATVTLTATPADGYQFSGWTISGTSTYTENGSSVTVTVGTSNVTATANFTATPKSYTLHVIDYYGGTPYLYAWDANGNLNGNFPGLQMTETEVSAVGETWYVQTFNSAAATINAIVSLGNSDTQTQNIENIAPGDYYIVYDSQTHTYTGSTTMPEGKQQAEKKSYTVYVLADNAPYLYSFDPEWNGNWPGTAMSETEQLADGNPWYKKTYETYDDQIKIIFNNGAQENNQQTADIIQTDAVAYYYYDGATQYRRVPAPTGKIYAIGQVGGNPWAANVGTELTANGDGTFSLNKVQIIAGATFAFATQLGANEDAWDELQQYRLNSATDGNQRLVTNAMTDKTNPTALPLQLWADQDKTFNMEETAYYDITFDSKTWTVTITRDYDAIYMYYGSHWAPNAGVPMLTTDGVTYTLTGVTLAEGGTFQFTKQLGADEYTWPADGQRLGANANGNEWIVTNGQLNIVLENALLAGSIKDFKMDEGTAGTYRVVVNPTAGTLALYKMAEVLGSKVIIHLEQTSNVTKPKLWAYDKERDVTNEYYIHVDRPSRKEIATNRRVFFANNTPNEANTITTADGRKWWTWEVEGGAICDFWFTRNDYDYANNLDYESNDNMTDIQWRKSGELFLTWPATGTALDDFTRDYYAAAAQEAADCAVMIEGHKYAYFTNTPGWDNVFCHAWYTDAGGVNHDLLTPPSPYEGDPCYPGALCELVGYDKDGYEVWRIDLTAAYNAAGITSESKVGILFNNGIDDKHNYEYDEGENHDYGTGEPTTAAKEQSSDFAYSTGTCYDYCGVIVLGRSLGNIIRNGVVNGPVYTIEDDLVGVYFDDKAETVINVDGNRVTLYGALYCKDMNNFVTTQYVDKSLQQEGQVDYMREYYAFYGTQYEDYFPKRPDRYDQSNWVKLTLSTQYPGYVAGNKDAQLALLRNYVGRVLPAETVRGQLVNNFNPEMHLALQALPDYTTLDVNNYKDSPNVFITSSFVGNQEGIDPYGSKFDFFFVTPKPQEYADITWALYNGNNEFVVCDRNTYIWDATNTEYYMNGFNLNGYFKVQWDMNQNGDVTESLVRDKLYQFKGIVRLIDEEAAAGSASAPRRAPGDVTPKPGNVTSSRYIVSPLNLSVEGSVITGVDDLTSNATIKQVESIQYVDVTGKVSSRPFDGVNIVVTRFTDGTVSTTKVVK